MGNMIKKGSNSVNTILQQMINPTETVNRVTVKTTVKTDEATHTIWETRNKYGNTATFTETKKRK